MSEYRQLDAISDWIALENVFGQLQESLTPEQDAAYRKHAAKADEILIKDDKSEEDYNNLYTLLGQMAEAIS